MKQVTARGQSVEEAVQSALAQLQATRDYVDIKIVDEGRRGFLGWIGGRKAEIQATLLPDPIEEALKFLKDVTSQMNVDVQVEAVQRGRTVHVELSGGKLALLIGKRGQTLNSLQYLTQLVANRYSKQYLTVGLDAEGYRKRREEALIQLAERMADKAVKTGKETALEPMPSFERKIIHACLANHRQITTSSSGREPFRHVLITPKR